MKVTIEHKGKVYQSVYSKNDSCKDCPFWNYQECGFCTYDLEVLCSCGEIKFKEVK